MRGSTSIVQIQDDYVRTVQRNILKKDYNTIYILRKVEMPCLVGILYLSFRIECFIGLNYTYHID